MKNWCICEHHLDDHKPVPFYVGSGPGSCWHVLEGDGPTYCGCYRYEEDDPDALLTQGALYEP